MNICSIKGCGKIVHAKGWCQLHHKRWWTHGNPLFERYSRISVVYRSEFFAWVNIKARCFNKNNPAYSYYGGRGITMCEKWKDSFASFLEDVGPRPNKNLSIDRINNDGDYEPGNVRWVTKSTQLINRRPSPKNKSGYRGVIPSKSGKKWIAQISVNNRSIRLGTFDEAIEAAAAFNEAAIKYRGVDTVLNKLERNTLD